MRLLAAGGLLLFSTNFRKFRLDAQALEYLQVRDITNGMVPFDHSQDPRVHACFEIRCVSAARAS